MMQKEFQLLAETLKTYGGQGPVYFLSNLGNWGTP